MDHARAFLRGRTVRPLRCGLTSPRGEVNDQRAMPDRDNGQAKEMVTVNDQFRKHAERCRMMAEKSPRPADRAFWLLLAENWQLLAQDSQDRQGTQGKAAEPHADGKGVAAELAES